MACQPVAKKVIAWFNLMVMRQPNFCGMICGGDSKSVAASR